jgi:membrane protein YdbS with pleckstrin-like domain
MASTSINVGSFGIDTTRSDQAVFTARPDMSIVKVSFLPPLLMVVAGIMAYLAPLPIDWDDKVAVLALIAGIGLVGVACVVFLYEGLSKAVYRLTNEYIEEEYGIIYKGVRRIPLSYVRDVTFSQNPLQAMFGLSSITVSPTNGNKIVLSNIRNAEQRREAIWRLVLARAPLHCAEFVEASSPQQE